MAKIIKLTAAALVLTGLAACNTASLSDLERAGLGAAIGCAVGEILDDGKCIAGAAVGAAGGALADDVGL